MSERPPNEERWLRRLIRRIGRIARGTVSRFFEDRVPGLAAAISYYTLFSLPPLLVFMLGALGTVIDAGEVQSRLLREIEKVVGAGAASQIQQLMGFAERMEADSALSTILGAGVLLFGATGALFQLQAALNTVWGVRPDPEKSRIRVQLVKRVLSLAMLLVIGFLLAVSMTLSAVVSWLANVVTSRLPAWLEVDLLFLGQAGLSFLMATLLFAAMFRFLADARLHPRDLWLGAAVTALLFQVGQWVFSFYITQADPGSVFGAAGSLALVLLWIYYSANVFLLGAEFTETWAEEFGRGVEPQDDAIPL